MGVSYKKLRIKMAEYNLKPTDIEKNTNISWSALTRINKDQPVNLSTLEEICKYFREQYDNNCDFGDIVEYIPKEKDSTTK